MTAKPERPGPADVVDFIETVVGVDLEPWQRRFAEAQFAHARAVDEIARTTLAAIVPGVAAAAVHIGRSFAALAEAVQGAAPAFAEAVQGAAPAFAVLDEIAARDDRFAAALDHIRTRNTGPARQPRPPRTINARGTRP
ncbi:hypothetical protein [Amycolatopsis azurea]|uniref:Uncharacterized protein n=1 Tax=Amycolatopsis azurea DSM 43854 TaxID=1238180 RepID=M2NL84_9PSEU|nr:hypothetical protein [Amycolatopsis azurea]EMD22904.1 hypothetical protein C791_7904 [Amycolatopsis azurea DSM 43854]OOC04269.1 hypothetical protein B0293_23720 [Amycolatopsis azurea DSM 43854]